MKHQIKNRFTGDVLFEADLHDDTPSDLVVREALVQASKADVSLAHAHLAGAYLAHAQLSSVDLFCAYLAGADLTGADLYRANLTAADLTGADLYRADLGEAYLTEANLTGANLTCVNLTRAQVAAAELAGASLDGGAKLVGERPVFQIGPIGSRSSCFVAYVTDRGLRFDAGCQRQITREEFEKRLVDMHGDNTHAREYRAALALIDIHAELWTPKENAE